MLNLLGARPARGRKIFDGRPGFRLLGLTATLTRSDESERKILAELFGGNTLYQVEPARLVREGILARPVSVSISTRENLDPILTDEDRRHLNRFQDLGEGLLQRIGEIRQRNQLILQEYLAHRQRYGQTLVFATGLLHAKALARLFNGSCIAADYIGYERSSADNRDIVARFRQGELEVLVNVQMITEGVDLPEVQTVFLTRPTTSEVLLTQMIGRALRGPAAGGTEKAFLVSFRDIWSEALDWMTPESLIADILEPLDPEPPASAPSSPEAGEATEPSGGIPKEAVLHFLNQRRSFPVESGAERFEAVPVGFYELKDGSSILVHEHQKPFWETLERGAVDLEGAVEHFEDCDWPLPARSDIERAWSHLEQGGHLCLQAFEERRPCDPTEVARLILQKDMGERERMDLILARYSHLARSVYPSLREFRHAIDEQLLALQHPEQVTRRAHSSPVFEDLPGGPLALGPHHDLPSLWTEMLRRGARILGEQSLPYTGEPPRWTRKIIKGWFGMADRWDEGGRIRINLLLDSPGVSRETILFLLWHEYLHIYLQQLHTPTFREFEHKWPKYTAADHELDTLEEKFAITYW